MMNLGGLSAEFVKSETDYRRERLAAQWVSANDRPRRSSPGGFWLHRFGFHLPATVERDRAGRRPAGADRGPAVGGRRVPRQRDHSADRPARTPGW